MPDYKSTVDVRPYKPEDKSPIVFNTFATLKPGEKMELVNDHDTNPIHHHLEAELQDSFDWKTLQEGPDVWRAAITRK